MSTSPALSAQTAELIKLITQAATAIENAYTTNNQPIPSLDPSSAADTGSDRGVGQLPSAEFLQNVDLLKAAADKLIAKFAPPPVHVASTCMAFLDSAAMHVVVDHGIADIIRRHDPDASKGVPVETIAVEAKLEPRHLARLLRHLANLRHIFVETAPSVFALNRHSTTLLPDSASSCINIYGFYLDEALLSAPFLNKSLSDLSNSAAFSIENSAFARAYGKQIFDVYAAEPARAIRFGKAMPEVSSLISLARSVAEDVPWQVEFGSRNPKGVFVDVGGGAGHEALGIAPKLPGWEFVVEDLPHVIETSAKELWDAHGSQINHRLVTQNFFEPQSVKGADIYYLKYIMPLLKSRSPCSLVNRLIGTRIKHDWPDQKSIEILKHIRAAADPVKTRLLIVESIITDLVEGQTSASALKGAGLAHSADLLMMAVLEAQERTLEEFRTNIIEPSGFKVVKVHPIRSHTGIAVIECVPV
ncbi:hypothetical protein OC845_002437 [Tilletia horrida]|nr:hypothetical protein OC845_002437 [Tilletia horrida]